MGYKLLCIDCKITKSLGTDFNNFIESDCTKCKQKMLLMSHRFRPPRKADDKKWAVVKYFIQNGFNYDHIFEVIDLKDGTYRYGTYVKYPENLRDAKEFVEKYKFQLKKQ